MGGVRAAAAAPGVLAGKGGRPSGYCMRDVVDGIRYLTHNGPVWRALPADFPPAWTIYYWAAKWQADGSAETMHGQLRERVRLLAGRKRVPSAAIIDSQSVRAAEEVARSSRGYDAGKKVQQAAHRRRRPRLAAAGWSSAHWPGSRATGAPSATTSGCPPTTRPASTGQ